jgi:hypothetical protein
MFKFYNKKNKKKGFTLVETLIAIFIFSLSVVVVMSVLSTGILSESSTKNKVVATYLAQEGIEYFRNMRDTYVLYDDDKKLGWEKFYKKLLTQGRCDNQEVGCYFHPMVFKYVPITDIEINPCEGECPPLLYSEGVYDYNGGEGPGFIRKMSIVDLASEQIKIISEVSWYQQGKKNTVLFSENLSRWME